MRTVKLLVNTTINGVFYEAGSDMSVDDTMYPELVRLGSCTEEVEEVKEVAPKKPEFGKTKIFGKKR